MQKFIFLLILLIGLSSPTFSQQKLSIEDFQQYSTFVPRSVSGLYSMKDGLHYSTLENGNKIVKYSYKTGNQAEVIFDLSTVENAPIQSFSSYEFSDDETKILLTTDPQQIYRRSFTAQYYIWNSVTKELSALSDKGRQQLATFSPDGERVAFVRDNNLFVKSLKFGTESQVTADGKYRRLMANTTKSLTELPTGFTKKNLSSTKLLPGLLIPNS